MKEKSLMNPVLLLFPGAVTTRRIMDWFNHLLEANPEETHVGDIGMYYLPYAEEIMVEFPNARFITLERDKHQVVESFLKKTEGHNHWMEHDGTRWLPSDKWDNSFPKFEANSKKEALEQYWDSYRDHTDQLVAKFPDKVIKVSLSMFNTSETQQALLDFVGFTGKPNIEGIHKLNATRTPYQKFTKYLRRNFWAAKRLVFGAPKSDETGEN